SFARPAPPPPALYPLSLHDALPILTRTALACPSRQVAKSASIVASSRSRPTKGVGRPRSRRTRSGARSATSSPPAISKRSPSRRSEEHTSELQSLTNLVCRLLLQTK